MSKIIKASVRKILKCSEQILESKKGFAFQPGSHYVLMENVTKRLPKGIIKESLEEYKEIAAWGSNGPDLGLIQLGELLGDSPWSNNFHYFKTGTFCRKMLEKALATKNKKEIAFAAAWLTHCCGDMACHGLFVNPEAGVYLAKPEGRPLHMELEKNAEPVLWVEKGGYDKEDYEDKGISIRFAYADELPIDLIRDTCKEVHGSAPSEFDIKSWVNVFHLALKTGVGYTYTPYEEASSYLAKEGRHERLMNGFDSAIRRCLDLLNGAIDGDYSLFVDRWNLDVGRSDSPVSNLHVAVKTASRSFTDFATGTDDYVYFGVKFKDGTVKEFELSNGKASGISVNDFEAGSLDKFYLYVDKDTNYFDPSKVEKIYLRKKESSISIGGDWKPEYIEVYMNGVLACKKMINIYLTDDNSVWESDLVLTHIPSIIDPKDPTL